MKNNIVRKGYNAIAKKYTMTRDIFEGSKDLDTFSQYVEKGKTTLDVGCGAGIPVDEYLIKKGFGVNGIDISEEMIALARKNVPEALYEVKDMSSLKEYEYCIDGIVSFYAIFHIPRERHQELFKKFASYLPTGGPILVTMGANGENKGEIENFQGIEMYFSYFPAEKNTEIIEHAGFNILVNEIQESNSEKHQLILARKI